MKKILLVLIVICACKSLSAQVEMEDNVYPVSGFLGMQSFTYKLVNTKYVTNENGYYLALLFDTQYVKFTRVSDSFHYKITRSANEKKYLRVVGADTFLHMDLMVEFTPQGKVKELTNWKVFRDVFMIGFSNQVRLNVITPSQFEEARSKYNDEPVIRRMVMEDITYLFSLYGDTFNTGIEYIRLKNIQSPFSGVDYYVQGNLKVERPMGTKNTVLFKALNEAGAKEKQKLMIEAQEKLQKATPTGSPVSELRGVGLSSEQTFQYNQAQNKMMQVTFSDIVVMDMSSNAYIRSYELWDMIE